MHALEVTLVAVWSLTLAVTILNLVLIPKLTAGRTEMSGPLVSVVIPARNEERAIEKTVRAFLAQTYASLEVVVVNDRSTDHTREILTSIGDPRVVIVDGVEPPEGWLGKPWACEQGCRAAKGELLLVVDADVHYKPPAVAAMVAYLDAHPELAMVAALPRFELFGFWEHVAMPMLAVTAIMFMPLFLFNRSKNPTFGIGGGTGNMIRRRDYDEMGGYSVLHNAVVDDVGMAHQLRAHGKRTHAVRTDDLTSLHMYHGAREIIHGFTKNVFVVFGGFVGLMLMVPISIVFHVLPYLLALRGDVLAIVVVALITVSRLLMFSSLRLGIINALFAHPLMALFWSWIFLRSMWFVGVRRELQWRGRSYGTTWSRFGKEHRHG